MLRYARSRPTQATAVDDVTVEVAVVRDGHVGSAETNRWDEDSLTAAARAAIAAAESAARHGGTGTFPGFPEPADARGHEGWDRGTAAAGPGAGRRRAGRRVRRRGPPRRRGTRRVDDQRGGHRNRVVRRDRGVGAGHRRVHEGHLHRARRALGLRDGDRGAGGRPGCGGRRRARRGQGRRGGRARDASAGRVPGRPRRRRRGRAARAGSGGSRSTGRPMSRATARSRDGWARRSPRPRSTCPTRPATRGPSPAPGTPRACPSRRIPLIQDGVAHRILHDTRTAAEAGDGARSTGHAGAPGGGEWGPIPTNLVLIGGGASDVHDLARPIERGIYVTRLWYTNPVRPKETLLTGMTRDGTFLIEDGRITRPLRGHAADRQRARDSRAHCRTWGRSRGWWPRASSTGAASRTARSARRCARRTCASRVDTRGTRLTPAWH